MLKKILIVGAILIAIIYHFFGNVRVDHISNSTQINNSVEFGTIGLTLIVGLVGLVVLFKFIFTGKW